MQKYGLFLDWQAKSAKFLFVAVTRAIEAVGAEVAFGQAYCLHHAVQGIEFQRIDTDVLAEHLDEVGIFRCRRVTVIVNVAVVITFQFLNAAARDEFQDILGGREVEEGAAAGS